jgi:hypothetical protein
MKKNQVKTSQSKPKKGTPDLPESNTLAVIPSEDFSLSSSIMNLDIPAEPSFKLPVKSTETRKECDLADIGTFSKDMIQFSKSASREEPQMTSEFSELESDPQELIKQIQDLQQEITVMTQRIVTTEEAMKHKDTEAQELKELLIRLRENQVMIMESSEKQSKCKSCELF